MDKPVTLPEWKEHLTRCLAASAFMALGTASEKDGAWVNPVNFAFDEKFNLYFLSESSTVHMQNIERDSRVSCAIYSTAQEARKGVVGVQYLGNASWVTPEEAEYACSVYFKETNPPRTISQSSRSEEYVKPDAVWRMAKVVPLNIWIFDEHNFGGTRVRVSPEVFGR